MIAKIFKSSQPTISGIIKTTKEG